MALICENPVNRAILDRLPRLGLPDAWLVSGCLFQTVWNVIDGRQPLWGIRDYDVFYFDPDLSWEAEDAAIRRVRDCFSDLGAEIELRNQARVHLWYETKFGASDYPRLRSACEGIDRFLNTFSMVGVQPSNGRLRLYAPLGLDDVFARVMRPNPKWQLDPPRRARYQAKAERWKALWPDLEVLPYAQ